MSKKSISAAVHFEGGLPRICYQLGNWTFLIVAHKGNGEFVAWTSFQRPKYAGGIQGPIQVHRELTDLPTLFNVWDIYSSMKEEFEATYATERIAYYQAKIDKIEAKIELREELPDFEGPFDTIEKEVSFGQELIDRVFGH